MSTYLHEKTPKTQQFASWGVILSVTAIAFGLVVRTFMANLPDGLMLLTLPYFVAGLALVAALYFSIAYQYPIHSALLILGIIVLCGIAA